MILAVMMSGLLAATIDQVAWLQGCWQMTLGTRVVEEQWMAPRGGVMLSMGRTVLGDRLVEYESIVLSSKDGQLAYEAHPSGQPAAVFTATTVNGTEVVFENPAHDYPQRVGYKREGDLLVAWIDGTVKGQSRRADFRYARVACQ